MPNLNPGRLNVPPRHAQANRVVRAIRRQLVKRSLDMIADIAARDDTTVRLGLGLGAGVQRGSRAAGQAAVCALVGGGPALAGREPHPGLPLWVP